LRSSIRPRGRRAAKRLLSQRFGDIAPPGEGLATGARLEGAREDRWIAERAGDGLGLRPDRGLLGYASQRPQGHGFDGKQSDAKRGMGIGARDVQRAVDPVHRVRMAVPDPPVLGERHRHRERLFGAALGDGPLKGAVEIVAFGIELGQVLVPVRSP
jgi:hypothetical protein